MNTPERTVHCQDALHWLQNHTPTVGEAVMASLPDISEFPQYSLVEWKAWFVDAAQLVMRATHPSGVCVFFQSDIKFEGVWVDKAYLVQKAAENLELETLFHKIICRAPAGTTTFGRPGYSHAIAFSRDLKLLETGTSTADVISDNGPKTWARGVGFKTCTMLAKFALHQAGAHTIINPFCGEGSLLAAANSLGLNAVGIERSAKRARCARQLTVNKNGDGWQDSTCDSKIQKIKPNMK